jgi:hypothetical protein
MGRLTTWYDAVETANRSALAGLPDADALVALATAADVATLTALTAVVDLDGLDVPVSVLLRTAAVARDALEAPFETRAAHQPFASFTLRYPLHS